jgi:excisionase family DNA binding protein
VKRAVPQYVSLAEGAEIVGVSVDTLRRRIRKGRLPAVRDGKLIRILIEDLYGLFTPIPTVGTVRRPGVPNTRLGPARPQGVAAPQPARIPLSQRA